MGLLARWYTKPSKPMYVLFLISFLAVLVLSPDPVSAIDPPPSDLNV